jgi:hypothetical protein
MGIQFALEAGGAEIFIGLVTGGVASAGRLHAGDTLAN